MLKRFAAAFRFLTVIPVPWGGGADEAESLRRSPALFPAVGAVLGIAAGLIGLLACALLPEPAAAALGLIALAAFSGGLHLDGLADSADALWSSGRDRERALAIMKDSRIGAHGAIALCLALLLKYACLSALPGDRLPAALFLIPVAGRAALLFPMALLPYLRASGLGALFAVGDKKTLLVQASLWTFGGMVVLWGIFPALAGAALWLAANLAWVLFLWKRLGGATGDSYGAACELGETTACLAAAMFFA